MFHIFGVLGLRLALLALVVGNVVQNDLLLLDHGLIQLGLCRLITHGLILLLLLLHLLDLVLIGQSRILLLQLSLGHLVCGTYLLLDLLRRLLNEILFIFNLIFFRHRNVLLPA